MSKFKNDQLIIYDGPRGFEVGRIKSISDDDTTAFIRYHSGDTPALTLLSGVHKVVNESSVHELAKKSVRGSKRPEEGQLVIYNGADGLKIGKVQHIICTGTAALIEFTEDDGTGRLTRFEDLFSIVNDYSVSDLSKNNK